MAKRIISDRLIKTLKPGDVIRDSELRGFIVRAYPEGVTYSVRRESKRRPISQTIGSSWDGITAATARKKAEDIIAQATLGLAPRSGSNVLTIENVWPKHKAKLKRDGRSPRTLENYELGISRLTPSVRRKPLRALSSDLTIMESEYDRIRDKHGEAAAAATGRTVRALYYYATLLDETLPARHPCKLIGEQLVIRATTNDLPVMGLRDLPRWWKAVSALDDPLRANFHLFSLLSGLRRNELYRMRWDDVDLDSMLLRVPRPKGGEKAAYSLPLSEAMVDCLKVAHVEGERPDATIRWVWPGGSRLKLRDGVPVDLPGHITGVETDAKRGVPVYLHGCRRSYASIARAAGVEAEIIGRLMNHNGAGITSHYIRTSAIGAVLRAAQERISRAIMAGIAGKEPGDEIDDYVESMSIATGGFAWKD